MNRLKKGGLVVLLLAVMTFGNITAVGAASSPTTNLPSSNTDVVNSSEDIDVIDTETVDRVNVWNTEEASEGDSEIGSNNTDTVNTDNNTTFIDKVRDILPKTGDTTNALFWILIMFACIAGATILVRIGIKNRPGKK